MSEQKSVRWGHYRDLPEGELLSDRFAEWWAVSDVFGSETLNVSMVRMNPGEEGPMHSHPVEEYYFFFEGTVDLEYVEPDTGEVESVKAEEGSIFYFPPGVPHRPVNNYDEPAAELAFRALPGSQADIEANFEVTEREA